MGSLVRFPSDLIACSLFTPFITCSNFGVSPSFRLRMFIEIYKCLAAERYVFIVFGERPCSPRYVTYLHSPCSESGSGDVCDALQNSRNLLFAEL